MRETTQATQATQATNSHSSAVPRPLVPARMLLRQCRSSLFREKVADSSGASLTGGKLLTACLIFRALLSRVLAADEERVGVLLPPSVGGVLANAALTLMRRVAVNLNYTMSDATNNYCIREAGIRHVLTSRRFIEKRPVDLDAELVFLEDLKEQISPLQRLSCLLQAFLFPAAWLERWLGVADVQPDDLLTIVFTSGSTGEPKGVMLSQSNVQTNICSVGELFHFTADDVMLGVLPFFHSFGYTGTLWLILTLDPKGVYHFNPLDGRLVGKLSEQHGVTILLSTPTFLRTYLKRCTPEQFRTIDLVVTGAEKLPLELAEQFTRRFGVSPTEGYGATETSPVAAFNVPENRAKGLSGPTLKLGTVGRVIPGSEARVVSIETGEDLGLDADGLLLLRGPNIMQGYWNQPEKTAAALHDGWYNTGDVARIDADGFITITGRQSRFSKIGGEMVPHIRVEEELLKLVDDPNDEQAELMLAVTAVPDPKKGERLVVIHRTLPVTPEQLQRGLTEAGCPNIWIPSTDSFLEVDHVPMLGTGKLDLKALRELALAHFGPRESRKPQATPDRVAQ